MKNILGIESTAHTFGIGIINSKGETLANIKDTFVPEEGQGFIPREAAEHHYSLGESMLGKALKKAKLTMKDISLIGFSQSPGIGQCLESGALLARNLSIKNKIPLLGVNHCIAHLEIGKLHTKLKDPLSIFVSGANTQIIAYRNKRYRVYGETLDMGLGNALDQFARELGIGFPGGPILDKMYFKSQNYIELPYTVKGMDLAFSGLLTAAKNKIGTVKKEDLVYSYLHTAYSMLLEVVERALSYSKKDSVQIVGGVAASKALNEMINIMAKDRGIKVKSVPLEYCGDNGLMIAWQAYLQYFKSKDRQTLDQTKINPKQRLDKIEINYL
jgi:N6-L-threonylcarbamoyladenine synthase